MVPTEYPVELPTTPAESAAAPIKAPAPLFCLRHVDGGGIPALELLGDLHGHHARAGTHLLQVMLQEAGMVKSSLYWIPNRCDWNTDDPAAKIAFTEWVVQLLPVKS